MWKVAGSLLFLGVGLSTVSYGQPGGAVDRGPDHEFMMAAASEGKTQVRLGQMISHAGRGDDAWLLGRRECAAAFGEVEPQDLATLHRGEALVLAGDCAEPLYRLRPQKLRIRPTCARTSL